MAKQRFDDKKTAAEFGVGYTKGRAGKEDAAIALFAMMYPTKDRTAENLHKPHCKPAL